MGRKSNLTDHQWAEIEERLLNGESQHKIAQEYDITQRGISKRLGSRIKEIETVALQMVEAKKAFNSLPVSAKVNAQTIIDRLMRISDHISSAAEYSAMNAHKFSQMAHEHLNTISPENLETNPNTLRLVNGLTTMANEASKIPLGLIQANKEQMQRINEPDAEQVKTLDEFYGNSSASSHS